MHPNNTKRGINMKQKRDHLAAPMDLSALPTSEAFKKIPELQRIGFYMMVWMAEQELRLPLKQTRVDTPESEGRTTRPAALRGWMFSVDETLPFWFATRYLR